MDIWCPNIGDATGVGWLDFERLAAERKKGRETWWYTMVEPKFPYPTWLVDDDALAVRSYGWLMARWGISGFVYSMAHGWGPDPLKNLTSFAGTSGDGTLLYPGELVGLKGPIPSIRLMLLRDAIEDYELLKLLPEEQRSLLIDSNLGLLPDQVRSHAALPIRDETYLEGSRAFIFDTVQKRKASLGFRAVATPRLDREVGEVVAALAPQIDGPVGNNGLRNQEWSPRTKVATDFNGPDDGPASSNHFTFKRYSGDPLKWPATSLFLTRGSKYLYAALRAREGPQVLEDKWFALEAAPPDGSEKWRFIVTAKNQLVVEHYTRQGRFRVENVDFQGASKTFSGYTDVEMAIPLSLLPDKSWRLNALRRVTVASGAKVTLHAFDDAGDARATSLFRLR